MQQIARNYLKEVPITTGVKKPILAMDLEASRQDVIARLRSAGKLVNSSGTETDLR